VSQELAAPAIEAGKVAVPHRDAAAARPAPTTPAAAAAAATPAPVAPIAALPAAAAPRPEGPVRRQHAESKPRRTRALPKGMGQRLWTMFWFTLALGFTGFGNMVELAYMPLFGWAGVAVAMLMYALWRDRTRPRPNGFWILLSILWFALAILPIRPYLGFVAAVPVALLWLHDSPVTPSAMLTWGLVATLMQDFDLWAQADADTAFYVVLAMVLFLGAAQTERSRLARRSYAPTGRLWMTIRLAVILLFSLMLVAGREALRAVNFFTYLGFDLRDLEGKVTVLMVLLASLAVAALLFRQRPYKYVDPYEQPRDEKGRRVARDIRVVTGGERVKAAKVLKLQRPGGLDFDSGPGGTPPSGTGAARRAPPGKAAAKPAAGRPAAPARKGPLRPGEIDFD